MINLIGEYEVSADAKGRFLLPQAFRKQLPDGMGDRFVLKKGFERCITLYTMDVWASLSDKVSKMNDFKANVREFKRLFLNGANVVDVDSADRMMLSKPLLEYAGIKKDIIMQAQGNKVEIWDKDTYNEYINQHSGGFSDLADDVANEMTNPFESL